MRVLTANSVLLGLILLLLTSCHLSDKPTRIVDGDPEPPAPSGPKDAWINWTTIEGVDRDKDGVRDDVEIWINNYDDNPYVRKAMKQIWKSEKEFHLLVEEGRVSKEDLLDRERLVVNRSSECLNFITFGDSSKQYYNDLMLKISSIRSINLANAKYSEMIAGSTGMMPGAWGLYHEGESYCDFNVPYADKIKVKIKELSFPTVESEKSEREKFYASKNWRP